MVENYDKYFDKVQNYSLSSESTNKQFLDLFYKLTKEKTKKKLSILKISEFNCFKLYYFITKY